MEGIIRWFEIGVREKESPFDHSAGPDSLLSLSLLQRFSPSNARK